VFITLEQIGTVTTIGEEGAPGQLALPSP